MSTKLVMHAFMLLEQLDLDQLDETIEWLETALAAYRTLRTVKACHAQRPALVEPPEEWVGAVDMDRQDRMSVTPPVCGPIVRKIDVKQFEIEMYLLAGKGIQLTKQVVAKELCLTRQQVGRMLSCTKNFFVDQAGYIQERKVQNA